MEVIKEAGRLIKSKVKGEKWVSEVAPVLVQINREINEIESKKKEECEPFRTQIKDISDKYKPALIPLTEMDSQIRERVMAEYVGTEAVRCEEGGSLCFPESWGYSVVDFSKVPKEYRMEVVNDKMIREEIKKGMRNIRGLEIKPIRSLRVMTKGE